MSVKCPYCGSDNILTERRLDGFHHCIDCHYSWKRESSLPKQTVFEQITVSPEVLASRFIYYSCRRWRSSLLPGMKFGKYPEALDATIEKLKEVAK